ncbi:hypothetical protein PG996_007762 [Apiospora saccharicola]|uniref:Uncharacterized protein n=1 Tax=Apiospora saccharicola TaxID=335842 RepID=A0ABR1VBR3_9PEZI
MTPEHRLVRQYNNILKAEDQDQFTFRIRRLLIAHRTFTRVKRLINLDEANNPAPLPSQGSQANKRLDKALKQFTQHKKGRNDKTIHDRWKLVRGMGEALDKLVRIYSFGVIAVFPFYKMHGAIGGGDFACCFKERIFNSIRDVMSMAPVIEQFFTTMSQNVGVHLVAMFSTEGLTPEEKDERIAAIRPFLQDQAQRFLCIPGQAFDIPTRAMSHMASIHSDSWLAYRLCLPVGFEAPFHGASD